ncbi:MAG: 3-oxoacyl-[acyl-carrier-protein] reductase [Dehalococcoidia bacterium]|nr:3-oxoacyl-[acyl-carrier-protein] reductase [Dehalococcoidia bacterium]
MAQSEPTRTAEGPQELAGRVALVTGGGRGIGKAIALKLATMGADVAVNYNASADPAETVVGELRDLGVRAESYQADITSTEQIDTMFESAIEEFGKVDILVNNAGIIKDRLLIRMTDDDWDRVVATDLRGAFACTRAAARSMMKTRWGRIINISSVVALAGNPGQANYAAAKSGLNGFTMSVAKELAPRNVTANIVAPGYITTDVTDALSDEVKKQLTDHIPLGRRGEAWEVAELVGFLCTPRASYITGQVLAIDGGLALTG